MIAQEKDLFFMSHALELAHRALKDDEIPIGALVINEQESITGIGYNQIETKKNQLAHAEIIAIQGAIAHQNDWRLDQHTLYVTIEPCMMCFGLIHLSRIERIVFGAPSPVFGITNLFQGKPYANHFCKVESGILGEDAALLIKQFFQQKRMK